MIAVFFTTFLLTSNGVVVESEELIGYGSEAGIECMAKKRQHEITRHPPTGYQGIVFSCNAMFFAEGEEI